MADTAEVSVAQLMMYAVVVVFPVAVFWAAIAVPRLVNGIVQRFRAPQSRPHGPPIEQLAADLRRVHYEASHLAPGTPIVRWRATWQAYDTLLAQACAAVEVPHRLDEAPEGFEREWERLRVEEALRAAGLTVS
jgi:hypothetical protein